MSLSWIHESPPRWNADKEAVIGAAPKGALDFPDLSPGDAVPGEWWRVADGNEVVGYGWMDSTWEGAEILLAVRPDRQGAGVGTFILEHLEKEAASRGQEYIFNKVRSTHPEREKVAAWLRARGFEGSEDGELRRRVKSAR